MEILEKAQEMERKGEHIIHLEVGEPDFDTPKRIINSLKTALDQGHTHYTHSLGDMDLRIAISEHYNKNYNTHVSPKQVVVTSGTSPALLLVLSVLIKEGDHVLVSDPGYACYPNFIKYLNAIPKPIKITESNGFQITANAIKNHLDRNTKAVIINSPMNPTGTIIQKNELEAIANLPTPLISDEIYHGLEYGEKAHSILEFTDKAFVINGFSKYYAMTGLRLGYLIAPPRYIRPIQKLQQNLFIAANSAVQRAGITALQDCKQELLKNKEIYNQRRKVMIDGLKNLGFKIPVEPTGAFYVLVDANHLHYDSYKLAFDILEKAKVGVTPGIDFGKNTEGYLRFSYANSAENIKEGMRRLSEYINNNLFLKLK